MVNRSPPRKLRTKRSTSMSPMRWLAIGGCLVLLTGCEAVTMALTEGGPEYKPGPQVVQGQAAPRVEQLSQRVTRLEGELVRLEQSQITLEQQRDRLTQQTVTMRDELQAMGAGVVVPPPMQPLRSSPPAAPQRVPATRPEVVAVPPQPVSPPRPTVDAEASKRALREGIALSREGKLGEAEAMFLRAIELDPTNARAHYAIGFVYNEKNQVDKALEAFKKAVEINPNDAKAHYGLGYIYDEKGMLDEAIVEFKRAIEINPNEERAHYNLGIIYEKKGMKEEAERELAIYNSLTSR